MKWLVKQFVQNRFVMQLFNLPCIGVISWEKFTIGEFWLLPAMCNTPSDISRIRKQV